MSTEIFNRIAQDYDSLFHWYVAKHYLDKRVAFVKSQVASGLVLDVGCGTGILAQRLEEDGFKVLGLDNSHEMLIQMENRKKGSPLLADASSIPLQENRFDLVISVVAMHHLNDPQVISKTISEMARVCKPEGKIIIWEHNGLNPYWQVILKNYPQDADVERLIPLSEMVDGLKAAGVSDISVRKMGFMPDFIPYILLWPFKILEKIVEYIPILNIICAHNVIVATKNKVV